MPPERSRDSRLWFAFSRQSGRTSTGPQPRGFRPRCTPRGCTRPSVVLPRRARAFLNQPKRPGGIRVPAGNLSLLRPSSSRGEQYESSPRSLRPRLDWWQVRRAASSSRGPRRAVNPSTPAGPEGSRTDPGKWARKHDAQEAGTSACNARRLHRHIASSCSVGDDADGAEECPI